MQHLTIEGKTLISKTLPISKIVYLALVKDILSSIIAQLGNNIKTIYLEKAEILI